MISIVVCHRSPHFLEQFKQSLADTIGLDYELIVVDNSQNAYGICQAYNLGGEKAQYDILCFAHEDILFHTPNWGQNLLQHFENPKVGAVGVAGSKIFSSRWFTFGGKHGFGKINILQHTVEGKAVHLEKTDPGAKAGTMVSLDGVFIACRKSVFATTPFDEQNLRHFHCYDMDFSLRVSQQHVVLVAYDILLEHISCANYNERFAQEFDHHFMPKWAPQLPLYTADFDVKMLSKAEWYLFQTYSRTPMMQGKIGRLLRESLKLFSAHPQLGLAIKIWALILFFEPFERLKKQLQPRQHGTDY
jgi:GT2 family glycosyltransferase